MATQGPLASFVQATVAIDGGDVAWQNPGEIYSEDGVGAQYNSTPFIVGELTEGLQATDFEFSMDENATIDGILVEVLKIEIGAKIFDYSVMLMKAGVAQGADRWDATEWPTSYAYTSYGGSGDLWGSTWTADEIRSTGFGVQFRAQSGSGLGEIARVDFIRITVTFTNRGIRHRMLLGMGR
jgi:hypothetical protein